MKRIESIIRDNKCVGCGSCVAVCPTNSISMVIKEGFWYPKIDNASCINCEKCSKACAIDSELRSFNMPQAYYASYAKKESMPASSTSGGICSLAARNFLENDRYVVAARFFDGWDLKHSFADLQSLNEFDGSKYMQSLITPEVLKNIKKCLKQDKSVLFIGTPCQVGGLISYLESERNPVEKLTTIDFMCHGVPSPILGQKFIVELEKKAGKTIKLYNFRSKRHGWGKMYRSVVFENGRENTVICNSCALHSWFGKHLSIRKSCFKCQYRRKDRVSDITVADFWGISKYYPNIPTEQGVSAVQINTEKGQVLYDSIASKCESFTVTSDSIWKDRKTALGNFAEPKEYNAFWQVASEGTIDQIIQNFPPETMADRMKQRIKHLLGR